MSDDIQWYRVDDPEDTAWRCWRGDLAVFSLIPERVMDAFPPLVEARAELGRLREGIVQHYHDHDAVFGVADAGFEWDLWRLVGFEQPDPTHLDDVGGDR